MGLVKSDFYDILAAIRAAESRARAEPPALSAIAPKLADEAVADAASPVEPAPGSVWMALYADLFDHHFQAVDVPGAGARFIPLASEDPRFAASGERNFLILENARPKGAEEAKSKIAASPDLDTPYAAHPSVLALLSAYALAAEGVVQTGALLTEPGGGPASWRTIQQQAEQLGLLLGDSDAANAPLLATDAFGALALGPKGGAQLVSPAGLIELDPAAPCDTSDALRSGQPILGAALPIAEHNAFLAEIRAVLPSLDDLDLLNAWLAAPLERLPETDAEIASLSWSGQMLFLSARFGAEMTLKNAAFTLSEGAWTELSEPTPALKGQDDVSSADDAEGAAFDLGFLAELARQASAEEAEGLDPIADALARVKTTPSAEELAEEIVVIDTFDLPAVAQDVIFNETAEDRASEPEPDAPPSPDYDL